MNRVTISAEIDADTPIIITITMPLSDWKYAREQFAKADARGYEAMQILKAITTAINSMEQVLEVPITKDQQ